MKNCFCFLLLMVVSSIASMVAASGVETCDVLFRNGTVHAGDGEKAIVHDIAVEDRKIAAVGPKLDYFSLITIDCSDCILAPGFIDLHTHSDDELLKRDTRSNINYLMQGCTTVVTGNCGMGHIDVAKFWQQANQDGAGTSVAHLLPHGSLRSKIMGKEDRKPEPEELKEMVRLAGVAMQDGAFGMATGLNYVPGTFAETEELIEIAKEIARHQGLYVSHVRGEGQTLLKSVEEAIRIGSEASCPTHISHF